MSEQRSVLVAINGEDLAYQIAYGKSDHCVDFQTGAIVPLKDCPEQEVGEGRPALQRGMRYIRIPNLDELKAEFKEQYDREDAEALKEEYGEDAGACGVSVEEFANEVTEEMRKGDTPKEDDDLEVPRSSFTEWCEFLNEMNAEALAAMRWIVSLRPSFRVAWLDEGGNNDLYELYVYDPATGEWEDA